MEKRRSGFTGGIGFILAAAGSAVGLGNLWRFPYLAAQYGGGIFILVYIFLVLTFGFALMTTEIAIGRKTGLSPVLAYGKLHEKFGFLGYIATIVPIIIFPYYSVIGGWVIKYVLTYSSGSAVEAASDSYFVAFIGNTLSPLFFFIVFLLITMLVVVSGIEKGIEKISKVLMPFLLVLIIGISIYMLTIPGALSGVKYYLLPDFSKFSFKTVCVAMGQMFFSMSLAMGIMITFGSYLGKQVKLGESVNRIEFFDTLIALLAGLMVIPIVYIYNGEEGLKSSGPGLMFISLPKIFEQMPGGQIIGLLFFVLVFFAALTSSVSIMEAIVSSIIDKFKLSRKKACVLTIAISLVIGIPSSLGFGIWSHIKILGMDFLSFFDYLSNSLLMPVVALLTCVFIGWVIGTNTISQEVTRNGEVFLRRKVYDVMMKYIAPIFLIIILVFYFLAQFGLIAL